MHPSTSEPTGGPGAPGPPARVAARTADRPAAATRRGGRGGHGGRGTSRRAPEPPTVGAAAEDPEPDQEQVARSIALRLLTTSPRSRAQLAEAMARKDVPEGVAERVLDRFEEVGLIDDAEYAAILVRTRHTERGLARLALAQELARKGIDRETAEVALAAVDREDEGAVARDLVRRRARATAHLPRETRMRRLVGVLARKGHPPGAALRIVAEVLDEQAAGEPALAVDLERADDAWPDEVDESR
ncbi:regulatory protein RecX [Miniimonas sp. S16]|uniref:regulatory protein RecX n=1 Tax=Miniimonas sp. S16 TaxID=2171623 RepID=UPI000D5261DB|nr:regulatory protein RecX [Miniimonas sp. S16]